jgi:hypothetical protein
MGDEWNCSESCLMVSAGISSVKSLGSILERVSQLIYYTASKEQQQVIK